MDCAGGLVANLVCNLLFGQAVHAQLQYFPVFLADAPLGKGGDLHFGDNILFKLAARVSDLENIAVLILHHFIQRNRLAGAVVIPLPHEIVVDMKKETTLTNISLTERQHDSYRDVKGGEFFVSSDKLNWTAVGAFEAQKVLEEQIFSITPTKGRYFKIKITDSYRASNSSLAEINAYGID